MEADSALTWHGADVFAEKGGTVIVAPRERHNLYRLTADEARTLASQLGVEAAAARARALAESPSDAAPALLGI